MEALRVEQLRRNFGALAAINGIDLAVSPGERRAIIGPNGAGKTTLFNLVSGELPPTSGRVFLNGQNVTGYPAYRLSRMGLARTFQKNNLFAGSSVFENARLAVQSRYHINGNFLSRLDRHDLINEETTAILDRVGLEGRQRATVRDLSYGEQRQLEVGIALATRPSLLLLDEPSAGMSAAETARMSDLVAQLPREITVLIIEHDMDVVFSLADRITVLHYGEVLAEGKPEEVRTDQRVLEVYLGVDGGIAV